MNDSSNESSLFACPICYEETGAEETVFLDCLHTLCKRCFPRLRQKICPLCRSEIKIDKPNLQPIPSFVVARVRFRRAHGRGRILIEHVSIGGTIVTIESVRTRKNRATTSLEELARKRERQKQKRLDNWRKNSWTVQSSHNRVLVR